MGILTYSDLGSLLSFLVCEGLKPHSRRTALRVSCSIHVIKNTERASTKFFFAFAGVSPWEATSRTGQFATYQFFRFTNFTGNLTVISIVARCMVYHLVSMSLILFLFMNLDFFYILKFTFIYPSVNIYRHLLQHTERFFRYQKIKHFLCHYELKKICEK